MTNSIQGVTQVEGVIGSSVAIKEKFADLWPAAMLGLGLVLTAVWNAGLFWLLFAVV